MLAAASLTEQHAAMYSEVVRTAHEEGFEDTADWRALDTPGHIVELRLTTATYETFFAKRSVNQQRCSGMAVPWRQK